MHMLWVLTFWEETINERKGIRTCTTCFFIFCQKNWNSPWKFWVSLKSNVKQSTQNLHTSDMVWTRALESNQSPWFWFNTHYWNMGLKVLVIAWRLRAWIQEFFGIWWFLKQNKSLQELWVCVETPPQVHMTLNHSCCPLTFFLVQMMIFCKIA